MTPRASSSLSLALAAIAFLLFVAAIGGRQPTSADGGTGGVSLSAGWNVVPYSGPSLAIESALGPTLAQIVSVWRWNVSSQSWEAWARGLPNSLQHLRLFIHDEV